jgi:hypothetical protein
MLDQTVVQMQLDEINNKYSSGLITLAEKLVDMITVVDVHTATHRLEAKELTSFSVSSQYDKAQELLRQIRRCERFEKRLDLHI